MMQNDAKKFMLIFAFPYAKLLPVTKTEKQGLIRVSPISGVK